MKTITVSTYIHVPLRKVWEFWNDPKHIVNWYHASDDWHAPYAKNIPKTGGKFSITMAARDGSKSFDFEGVYTEVSLHKLIRYILADDRKVTVFFHEDDKGVRITEVFDAEEINSLEKQQSGWQAILDNFKAYAEKNK